MGTCGKEARGKQWLGEGFNRNRGCPRCFGIGANALFAARRSLSRQSRGRWTALLACSPSILCDALTAFGATIGSPGEICSGARRHLKSRAERDAHPASALGGCDGGCLVSALRDRVQQVVEVLFLVERLLEQCRVLRKAERGGPLACRTIRGDLVVLDLLCSRN